jgi:putative transcriptional regulator
MAPAEVEDASGVHCRLDELLAERTMTLTRLSELVGVSIVNLSVLKNDRAKAIRFSTLSAICRAFECEIGDLLVVADPQRQAPGQPLGGARAIPP